MVKSGLEVFILKYIELVQSCCCPVPKNLPSRAELAWQASRYLWRGSVNFKINSRPLFTIIFKVKNVNFMTRDFSSLIEWVLAGVGLTRLCLYKNSSENRLNSMSNLLKITINFWTLCQVQVINFWKLFLYEDIKVCRIY